MGPHEKALDGMFDDLDGMESKKMFGDEKQDANAGVDITISVVPKSGGEPDGGEAMMNKGGVACMDEGGIVPEEDDMTLPPFLRKKKIPINK